jgi:predicted transcriptional regulator
MSQVKDRVRLSLDVSKQLNEKLEDLAERIGGSKSEVLRRAITLMEIAVDARASGKRLGIADKDLPLSTEIVTV